MYTPTKFKVEDTNEVYTFIKQHRFGLLLTIEASEIHDTQTPFILSEKEGLLYGHIAKANPQWNSWNHETTAKVIFSGPHTYISPLYYNSEFNVPTWNYTAASISGSLTIIDDKKEVLQFLDQLVKQSESQDHPWELDHTDERYMNMLDAIIVFKIKIDHLDASFKLNQNKSKEDQQGVIHSLEKNTCPYGHDIAQAMKKNQSHD